MIAHASGVTMPDMVTFELGVIGETRVRSQNVKVDSLGRFSSSGKTICVCHFGTVQYPVL